SHVRRAREGVPIMPRLTRGLSALARWLAAHPRAVRLALAAAVLLPVAYLHPWALLFAVGVLQLDDVNTVVTKEIQPGVVDAYFRAGPAIAMCRQRFTRKWIGPQMQENFQRTGSPLR